jgi:hypothetical protein
VNVKVYVEGGGLTNALRTRCREGFSEFFRKAGLEGRMPRIVAGGGRREAFDDFCTALKKAGVEDFIVLLVDSEAPVAAGNGPWMHLKSRDEWDKPVAATDDNAHLMVQCMEAWFLADKDTLAAFFGNGFNRGALPARPEIEDVAKADVLNGLKAATRHCGKKGEYGKGRHSFEILALLDPAKVTGTSPYAKRLVDTLTQKAEG